MADETGRPTGPVMLAATGVLRPGRSRVGKLGKVSLPRTVSWISLGAGAAGVIVGALIGVIINPSIYSALYGAVFGGVGGVFIANYSPLQGESFWSFLRLSSTSRRGRLEIDGKRVKVAIGICPISNLNKNDINITRGAVPIPLGQHDDRGVPISKKNGNTDEQLAAFYAKEEQRKKRRELTSQIRKEKEDKKIKIQRQANAANTINASWSPGDVHPSLEKNTLESGKNDNLSRNLRSTENNRGLIRKPESSTTEIDPFKTQAKKLPK